MEINIIRYRSSKENRGTYTPIGEISVNFDDGENGSQAQFL